MFLYSSWQQLVHLGPCDYVMWFNSFVLITRIYFALWLLAVFCLLETWGDKLLEHRINMKCSSEFKKNANTIYSEYI
jgi:hypothetical protein